MSTDASLFPIHFFDCDIYCGNCKCVEKFKVFSQEKYDKHYSKSKIPPNKPLFCRCEKCDFHIIYATNEFAELQEEPTQGFCKIWGMGSLAAGDLVYHPEEGLCSVDSVFYGTPMRITLIDQKRKKLDFTLDALPTENRAETLYRLFPQNSKDTRIGDLVYHTDSKVASKVVGLNFNGVQDIIVTFDNKDVEWYDCEKTSHYLTDELLEQNATWRCRDLPYNKHLKIYSRAKILFVNCKFPNFGAVCELERIIASIPQARCFVMHIAVEKLKITAQDIYMELLKNAINLCSCHIEYEDQSVYISGFYSSKSILKNIHRVLSKFPLKKINLDLKMRPDMKHIKTINEDHRFIKITKIEKDYHIDGWVKTEKEKRKEKLRAFRHTLSFKIQNHLQIIEEE